MHGKLTIRLTREARTYAVKEILRRSGIPAEKLQECCVDVEGDRTTARIPGTGVSIRFLHDEPQGSEADDFQGATIHATWPVRPTLGVGRLIPDFVVPCRREPLLDGNPLFTVDRDLIECPFDLPKVAFWALSRIEELQIMERGPFGCFFAHQSRAARDGFLERPFVDEYGIGLESVLTSLIPNWRPVSRSWSVKLSHDIDLIGLPHRPLIDYLLHAVGRTVRGRPLGTFRDLASLISSHVEPVDLKAIATLCRWSIERKLDSACYWKVSSRTDRDSGYDLHSDKVRRAMDRLQDAGIETGIHPSYYTFNSPESLEREVQSLEDILGTRRMGGRQHYLRWSPQTWNHWEQCRLAYDSTLGYNDRPGFRAGTCIPYRPWLLTENRQCDLLEIPLVAMDVTFALYMKFDAAATLELLRVLSDKCRLVGGVFTLLWHNHSLAQYPKHTAAYLSLLDQLADTQALDWQTL